MNDPTAYALAKDFIALPFCAFAFWLMHRQGVNRGALISGIIGAVIGFLAICIAGSRFGLWNFSAAIYRSLGTAWCCAFLCTLMARALYKKQ